MVKVSTADSSGSDTGGYNSEQSAALKRTGSESLFQTCGRAWLGTPVFAARFDAVVGATGVAAASIPEVMLPHFAG